MSRNTELDTFLHNLHFHIDELSPPDWNVDWEDAPLPYKLYRGVPTVSLPSEVPLTLGRQNTCDNPDFRAIGPFLWYVYGLSQTSQSVMESTGNALGFTQMVQRFVPSGGALYPNEVYVYLKIKDTPRGVYHYDAAHHRLFLLREGNYDSYLTRALDSEGDIRHCFATVFVSTMFWKNVFKYNQFAYRLQGLDTGVLIGQLLEVAKRFGFEARVHFQFLDRAVNHLLGLSEQEESVYAVIPLSVERMTTKENRKGMGSAVVRDIELCRELPKIECKHVQRSTKVLEYPLLLKMNEASGLTSTGEFYRGETRKREWDEEQGLARKSRTARDGGERGRHEKEDQRIKLPYVERLSYDLALACQKRFSPGMDFVFGKVSLGQLATLLQEAILAFSYYNDIDATFGNPECRISLYLCLHHMEGIPDGAYVYDHSTHSLHQLQLGDQRYQLQNALNHGIVNLFQVPLCFHVAGDRDHYVKELGYRGYRIQQMEAGMLVQRLLLISSGIGMNGHPLLGFDANKCDQIYQLVEQNKTSLIQVPIGSYRPRPWLRGGLHS